MLHENGYLKWATLYEYNVIYQHDVQLGAAGENADFGSIMVKPRPLDLAAVVCMGSTFVRVWVVQGAVQGEQNSHV